jgi:hypothetical protein
MKTLTCVFAMAGLVAAAQNGPPQDSTRLVFSTYHGGDRNDDANGVAVDSAGFIYVTGETESRDLANKPVGGKPLTSAVFKGYLTKYSPSGKDVVWRLLIGGGSNTVPHAVAVDKDDNIFVTGVTGAADLPLKNPVQSKQTGLNIAFLMKFDPDGELLFSTFLGGERNDDPRALATDSAGNIYIAGRASSSNFPVKDALQPKIGGSDDGFIAKFNADLTLAYSTYLGGAGSDQIHALAVGPDDSVYVVGETLSPGMATAGAYIGQVQSYSSFAARISPAGDAILYYTYVGWRGGYTVAKAVAVDSEGRAWIGGHTSVKTLPLTDNAIQDKFGGGMRDGFLLRLTADGSGADYLSPLGGSFSGPSDPDETVEAMKVDARGHLHVAGQTNSPDFPGYRPMQEQQAGAYDAYVLRLDPDNKQILYSTFWGGSKNDLVKAVALGPGEAVTVVGDTYSPDLPVARAAQPTIGSANDAFVAQFCDPWLGAWSREGWNHEIEYVRGAEELPAAIELDIYSGCPRAFAAAGPETEAGWLKVAGDGGTVPMKLRIEVNPEGLEPGEYKTSVRIAVPDAFRPVLEIPVTLRVVDPPPPAE